MFQGGLADYPLDFYVSLVRVTKEHYPDLYPHYFTAPELWNCAKVNNLSIREVLQALYDAGQRSIPGGGAEIVSERVRLAISPKKMEPGAWIALHRTAHAIGFRSTATMMYGHVEEPEDILTHLETLRQAQDEIPGFTAFIPWSYKRDRTALRRRVKHWAGPDAYLRILAFARLYLDDFDHIQASWFGRRGGRLASAHCNTAPMTSEGSTWRRMSIAPTGFVNRTDHNGILSEMIREAGYGPGAAQPPLRDPRDLRGIASVEVPEAQRVKEENRLSILQDVCS